MADEPTQTITQTADIQDVRRSITEVKRLQSLAANTDTYTRHIRPFLFATATANNAKQAPGGLVSYLSEGKIISSESANLSLPTRVGSRELNGPYQINSLDDDSFNKKFFSINNQDPEKKATSYLFYSDVISILLGIVRFFLDSSNSAEITEELREYAQVSYPDSIKGVLSEWGDADEEGRFIEQAFEQKSSPKIAHLLEAIIAAAQIYEGDSRTLDEAGFVLKTELLKEHLLPHFRGHLETAFFKKYQEQITAKEQKGDLPDFSERLATFKKSVEEYLTNKLSGSNFDFFDQLTAPSKLEAFKLARIYSPSRNAFLPKRRDSDGLNGVLESEQYKEFVSLLTPAFLLSLNALFEESLRNLLSATPETESAQTSTEQQPTDQVDQGGAESTISTTPTDIDQNQLKEQLLQDSTTILLERFFSEISVQLSPEEQERFLAVSDQIINQNSQELYIALQTKIAEQVRSFNLTPEQISELVTQQLATEDPSRGVVFSQGFFDSTWYQSTVLAVATKITQDNTAFFSEFYQQQVVPLVPASQAQESTTPSTTPVAAEAAPITPPPLVTPISEVGQSTNQTNQGQENSQNLREQINREFQLEVELLVAQTSRELFGSDLTLDQIQELSPELIQALRNEIIVSISGSRYAKQKLQRMRLQIDQKNIKSPFEQNIYEAVRDFSQKHSTEIGSFKQKLELSELWQGLDSEQQARVSNSFGEYTGQQLQLKTSRDVFATDINAALNIQEQLLLQNVQNSLDSIIVLHGVSSNTHDALWLIENTPISRLAVLLGIPAHIALPSTLEEEKRFRAMLSNSTRDRVKELVARAKTKDIEKGLRRLSDAEARALLAGDSKAVIAHGTLLGTIRKSVAENGAETVAGAVTHKKSNSRKKTIEEQFKTFVPLWFQLSPEEQLKIYAACDVPVPRGPDFAVSGYPFIGEFVFFDTSKLRDFSAESIAERVRRDLNLAEEERAAALEAYRKWQDAEAREEAAIEYANIVLEQEQEAEDEYYAGLLLDELYLLTSEEEEAYYAQQGLAFGENSYQDVILAQQTAKNSGALDLSRAKKITNVLRGKRNLNNTKLSETFGLGSNKFKKGSGSKRGEAAWAVARAGANLFFGAGTILSAVKNRALRNKLTAAIYGFAVTGIVALGTTGGKIGAFVGGTLGSVLPGLGTIGGAFIGSNIGYAIQNGVQTKGFFGYVNEIRSGFGAPSSTGLLSTAANNTTAVTAKSILPTAAKIAPQSLAVATSGVIESGFAIAGLGLGVGTVAPLGGMLFVVFISIYTVFMIQASFLVPIPASGKFSDLPPGLDSCWPVGGKIAQLPSANHKVMYRVDGIGQAFDINQNNLDPIYASHDGVAKYAYMEGYMPKTNPDGTITPGKAGYGNYVTVTSSKGYITLYGHMSNVVDEVRLSGVSGIPITKGTLIGYVGTTGYSTGAHLHYEYSGGLIRSIVPNGEAVDEGDMVIESCSAGGESTIE